MEKGNLFKNMDGEEFEQNWRALHNKKVAEFIIFPYVSPEGIIKRSETPSVEKSLLLLSTAEGNLTAGCFGNYVVSKGTGFFESFSNDPIKFYYGWGKRLKSVMITNTAKKQYAFFNSTQTLPPGMSAIFFASEGKSAMLCTAIHSENSEIEPICFTRVEARDVAAQFLQLSAAFMKANLAGAPADFNQLEVLKRLAGKEEI